MNSIFTIPNNTENVLFYDRYGKIFGHLGKGPKRHFLKMCFIIQPM